MHNIEQEKWKKDGDKANKKNIRQPTKIIHIFNKNINDFSQLIRVGFFLLQCDPSKLAFTNLINGGTATLNFQAGIFHFFPINFDRTLLNHSHGIRG